MKAPRRNLPTAGSGGGGVSGPITGDTYETRAISFGRMMGYGAEGWPVVKAGQQDFADWIGYFAHIGHPHGRTNSFAQSHGVLTVPAQSPHDFDPGFLSRPSIPFRRPE